MSAIEWAAGLIGQKVRYSLGNGMVYEATIRTISTSAVCIEIAGVIHWVSPNLLSPLPLDPPTERQVAAEECAEALREWLATQKEMRANADVIIGRRYRAGVEELNERRRGTHKRLMTAAERWEHVR